MKLEDKLLIVKFIERVIQEMNGDDEFEIEQVCPKSFRDLIETNYLENLVQEEIQNRELDLQV